MSAAPINDLNLQGFDNAFGASRGSARPMTRAFESAKAGHEEAFTLLRTFIPWKDKHSTTSLNTMSDFVTEMYSILHMMPSMAVTRESPRPADQLWLDVLDWFIADELDTFIRFFAGEKMSLPLFHMLDENGEPAYEVREIARDLLTTGSKRYCRDCLSSWQMATAHAVRNGYIMNASKKIAPRPGAFLRKMIDEKFADTIAGQAPVSVGQWNTVFDKYFPIPEADVPQDPALREYRTLSLTKHFYFIAEVQKMLS